MKKLTEKDWDKTVKATLKRRGKIDRSKHNKGKDITRTKSNNLSKIKRKFG